MSNKLKVYLWCQTNMNGSKCKDTVPLADYGFTDDEWNALPEKKQQELLSEWAMDFMNNNGEMGAIVE